MRLNEPTVLKVREFVVNSKKKTPNISVIVTGDWHVSPIISERQAEFLTEAIEETKPDVIILQGDMVDSPMEFRRETSLKKLETELKICSKAAPTMLVLGSHDFITPTSPARVMKNSTLPLWKKLCKKCKVKLLMDESYEPIPGVVFYGLFQDESTIIGLDKNGQKYHENSAEGFLKQLEQQVFKLDPKKFNWFVSHAPLISKEVIEKLSGFDMASFGHTHGGIVPRGVDEVFDKLGLNFGLISTKGKPFPSFVRGIKPVGESTLMLINPGMTGAQFCAPRFLQNMNFVKAAEVSVVKLVNAPKGRKSD